MGVEPKIGHCALSDRALRNMWQAGVESWRPHGCSRRQRRDRMVRIVVIDFDHDWSLAGLLLRYPSRAAHGRCGHRPRRLCGRYPPLGQQLDLEDATLVLGPEARRSIRTAWSLQAVGSPSAARCRRNRKTRRCDTSLSQSLRAVNEPSRSARVASLVDEESAEIAAHEGEEFIGIHIGDCQIRTADHPNRAYVTPTGVDPIEQSLTLRVRSRKPCNMSSAGACSRVRSITRYKTMAITPVAAKIAIPTPNTPPAVEAEPRLRNRWRRPRRPFRGGASGPRSRGARTTWPASIVTRVPRTTAPTNPTNWRA